VTAVTILHFVGDSAMMHSMTESAPTLREAKRLGTARRIAESATALTRERGLDGWTMDDLAEAAEVSRRTLFNYVSSKVDAVLGPVPEFPAEAIATFRAGGPHGRLLDDARVLARAILEDKLREVDATTSRARRELLLADPRLLVIVHERFETVTAEVVEHVLEREGRDFGVARARLFVRLLVAVFEGCLGEWSEESGLELGDLYDQALADARQLLA